MIVYAANKQQFLKDCFDDDIEEIIQNRFKEVTGKRVAEAEIESWRSSLTYVAKVLWDKDISSEIGVAVELHIPQSSKRIDRYVFLHITMSIKQYEHFLNVKTL